MAESVVFQVVIEALSIPDKTCHYVASAGNKPTLYNLSILSEMDRKLRKLNFPLAQT